MKLGLGLGFSRQPPQSGLAPISGMSFTGNAFTASSSSRVTPLTDGQIALFRESTDELLALEFDGTDFQEIGTPYALGIRANAADGMGQASTNRAIWFDHDRDDVYFYLWNGSTWTEEFTEDLTGSEDHAGYPAGGGFFTQNVYVYAAGNASGDNDIVVRSYDPGVSTTDLGVLVANTGNYGIPIVVSEDRFVVVNTSSDTLQAYSIDGSYNASPLGSSVSIAGISGMRMGTKTAENEFVTFIDNTTIAAYSVTDSGLTQLATFSVGTTSWPTSIAKLDDNTIALQTFTTANVRAIALTR